MAGTVCRCLDPSQIVPTRSWYVTTGRCYVACCGVSIEARYYRIYIVSCAAHDMCGHALDWRLKANVATGTYSNGGEVHPLLVSKLTPVNLG